ncbi:MAG: tRNA (adenosine(37)-N6)-dimethylallyltransferase MiaA [Patescibacteria group bacterium]
MSRTKIIMILGPTASGKSELAVKIAKKINGEIVSADSRQVYKGLNIGTGKVNGKWRRRVAKSRICGKEQLVFMYKNIPHYCIDYVSPKKRYTVIDFKKCAEGAIKDIFSRRKIPIICGGTGFYISVITGGIDIPEIKPNWKLRKKLEKKSTEELFKTLKKLDPKRAKNIDRYNPRRLIRAIEIAEAIYDFRGGVGARLRVKTRENQMPLEQIDFLVLGIKLPEKELKKRIEKRVKKMFRDDLIREVKNLRNPPTGRGLSWKRLYELGFEYKYPAMFLQGKIKKQGMIERMILENWHYAKRQIIWFKKYQPETKWIKNYKEIERLLFIR